MSFLISIIPTLIVLGVLILIHELGHFIACRMTGVGVEKFSIGFGPELVHWQGRETRYAVSLFPLGGYVKPAGESVSEVEEEGGAGPGDYLAAPLWARIVIVCAGVVMNYFLAFAIFTAMFMVGRPVPGTTIGGFVEDYPAYESELQKGDRVVEINGREVGLWSELTSALDDLPAGEIRLTVERRLPSGRSEMLPVSIEPRVEKVPDIFGEEVQVKRLGITPHPEASHFEKYGFFESVYRAGKTTVFLTVMTHKAIFYLILGKLSMNAVSGPVGIISMAGDAAQMGVPYLLQLTATLSVSLAVINLLPIPALDGGHLFFLVIEGVRRKRVSLQVQERMTQVGFTLLLVLMVFLIYNDLVNIDAFGKLRNLFGS